MTTGLICIIALKWKPVDPNSIASYMNTPLPAGHWSGTTERPGESTAQNNSCTFDGTLEQNLQKLKNLHFKDSIHLMDELGFSRVPNKSGNSSLPVMVTGMNSAFYNVMQGLVKSIHEILMPKYPDIKLIIYDMGLTEYQHQQYVFHEFGHVWWLDSSVRFVSDQLEGPVDYLQQTGALFFTYGPLLNVALHTHQDTFTHFQEDPCPYMYFGEIEAGNVAFVNNDVGQTILNRWVSCALDASCISPPGAKKGCKSPTRMGPESISRCHRYDQSALSVILRRLYHDQNDYPMVPEPFRIIRVIRRQAVFYFPED